MNTYNMKWRHHVINVFWHNNWIHMGRGVAKGTLRGYSSRNIPNFRKCVYFYILQEYTCTYCLLSLCKRSNRKSNPKDVNVAIKIYTLRLF